MLPLREEAPGTWSRGNGAVTGLAYIGQPLQLLALSVRDHAVHHHPLGAVQDSGVHGEADAFIEQGTT